VVIRLVLAVTTVLTRLPRSITELRPLAFISLSAPLAARSPAARSLPAVVITLAIPFLVTSPVVLLPAWRPLLVLLPAWRPLLVLFLLRRGARWLALRSRLIELCSLPVQV
jgi:hypothetical protein